MGLLASADDDKKPLFSVWASRQKKAKVKAELIRDVIIMIRLSASEEWILIECKESVALLNAESKVGKAFWKIVEGLDGEMKALEIVPSKGKLRYDIEVSKTLTCTWEEREEGEGKQNNFFGQDGGNTKEKNSLGSLKLSDMKIAVSP